MNQLEILFEKINDDFADIIISELAELGFESFWQSDKGLRAYIEAEKYNEEVVKDILTAYPFLADVSFSTQEVTAQSWDVASEDHFDPIVIDHRCRVSASTHPVEKKYPFELVVNAKLSFGSGHHPSTNLCLDTILSMNLEQESVLDIGCGSGILSLLAEKKGATDILAFDNNPWAIEVAQENLSLNNSKNIDLLLGDTETIEINRKFPVVFANLNASVLLVAVPSLVPFVAERGQILLSGYMQKDEKAIHKLAKESGLRLSQRKTKDEWLATVWKMD